MNEMVLETIQSSVVIKQVLTQQVNPRELCRVFMMISKNSVILSGPYLHIYENFF